MDSSLKNIASLECLEQLSDRSEVDMTTDTEAEGPTSSAEQEFESLQQQPYYSLGTKSESGEGAKAKRVPKRPSVFHAWQQSVGYTRNRVIANVQKSITNQRKESMRAYKLSKRSLNKVSVAQQTDGQSAAQDPSLSSSSTVLDLAKLQRSVRMVLQDENFSICLSGLITLNAMTSEHTKDFPIFFTYSALIIESGVLTRLNKILLTQESEFEMNQAEGCHRNFSRNGEAELESPLTLAKVEALSILINLSFNNDQQLNSIVKHGCIHVMCRLVHQFDSMTVLKKVILALANFILGKPSVKYMLFEASIQHKLLQMYEKLACDSELCNEIVFFMHNCLTCDSKDLTNADTLLSAKVICQNLNRLASIEDFDKFQVYVLKRTLLALESGTKNNRSLLSEMAADFYLHRSLVTALRRLLQEDSDAICVGLKLVNRLLKRHQDAEFHFFKLSSAGLFATYTMVMVGKNCSQTVLRQVTKTLKLVGNLKVDNFDSVAQKSILEAVRLALDLHESSLTVEVRCEVLQAVKHIAQRLLTDSFAFQNDYTGVSWPHKALIFALKTLNGPRNAHTNKAGERRQLLCALECLDQLFRSQAPLSKALKTNFEEAGGLCMIESLQEHPDHSVYKKARSLLERHFSERIAPVFAATDCITLLAALKDLS